MNMEDVESSVSSNGVVWIWARCGTDSLASMENSGLDGMRVAVVKSRRMCKTSENVYSLSGFEETKGNEDLLGEKCVYPA